jgi:hypothetical protein
MTPSLIFRRLWIGNWTASQKILAPLAIMSGIVLLITHGISYFIENPVGWLHYFPSTCSFKMFFHLPCVTCGLTRGFLSLAKGDIILASRYNPLTLPLYLSMWGLLLGSIFLPEKTLELLQKLLKVKVIYWILSLLGILWFYKLFGPSQYW